MCQTCGCTLTPPDVQIHAHDTGHVHHHDHEHSHSHHHGPAPERLLEITQSILSKNDRLAERNRGYFQAKEVYVLNLLSSPGAGKTSFIERTLRDCQASHPMAVIVGDLETDNDAQRLRQTGAKAIQITTGNLCHLEAEMISQAARRLDLEGLEVLFIENVGNLVCPAAYDLGENLRLVLFSVTEGEDKPLKYPTMFKSAQVVVITKIDIAEAVGFDRDMALKNLQQVAPQATILEVSARSGQGMATWYHYLTGFISTARASV
ncbi:hydrogenase nickel incorporation protein HypB [Synechocystis sp. LKSZ1]|uniref:hydrogenase nickel incorporation protein HypB n=1 Tax=Synechocystis sp. LKSZ1 TaxID=3144951 RepID=UPI00336BF13A